MTPQRQAAGAVGVGGVTSGHVLHSAMLAGSDAHRQASGGPAVQSGELASRDRHSEHTSLVVVEAPRQPW